MQCVTRCHATNAAEKRGRKTYASGVNHLFFLSSFPLSLPTGERRERVKGQDHPGNIYTVAPSRNDSFPFPSLCLSHSLAISHGNDRSIRHKSRGGGTIEI